MWLLQWEWAWTEPVVIYSSPYFCWLDLWHHGRSHFPIFTACKRAEISSGVYLTGLLHQRPFVWNVNRVKGSLHLNQIKIYQSKISVLASHTCFLLETYKCVRTGSAVVTLKSAADGISPQFVSLPADMKPNFLFRVKFSCSHLYWICVIAVLNF